MTNVFSVAAPLVMPTVVTLTELMRVCAVRRVSMVLQLCKEPPMVWYLSAMVWSDLVEVLDE